MAYQGVTWRKLSKSSPDYYTEGSGPKIGGPPDLVTCWARTTMTTMTTSMTMTMTMTITFSIT